MYTETVTFSFNPKTSCVGYHRVRVLKMTNIATLSTCPLYKNACDADGVEEAVFRDFCTLHTIRGCVNMCTHCVVHVRTCIQLVGMLYF